MQGTAVVCSELGAEIKCYKSETARVLELRRRLAGEKEKLGKELRQFEQQRESELAKIEEEKRRLKRDKLLLDKAEMLRKKISCYQKVI